MLARGQVDDRSAAVAGEPVYVADLDGQAERAQRRSPAVKPVVARLGVNALLAAIESFAAVRDGHDTVVIRPERRGGALPSNRCSCSPLSGAPVQAVPP